MAKGTYHRVRDGQDLLLLAEWYYGDSMAARHIFYANLDIYGDDFEMIPAGSKIFIPDLEVSDVIESYTGPAVTIPLETQNPMPVGSLHGSWGFDQESSGDKYLFLTFAGEQQTAD